MRLHSSLFILAGLLGVLADRQYTIKNSCPSSITLFINGAAQSVLKPAGGTFQTTVPNDWSGFIYTDANGGNQNGTGTTRAGFYGQDGYYYIVKDPAYFNTGVTITPQSPVAGAFCAPASCTNNSCSTAYSQPPTAFPPPSSVPATPPLYECPGTNIAYTVEFCPGGSFPPPGPVVTLHPNGNAGKCLDVRGAVYANGTPVQIYDCNGTGAQKWRLTRGNTKVQVAGTNFCLDAGSAPASGVGLKIWTCYENLAAQSWYYTNDNRVALFNQGQCVDLTNGVLTNSNQVQTWQCTDNNTNQIWTGSPAS
ncbi:putative G-X-X-X-Q-X-W domain-containing protein [Lyophyllum shimeji]|uniref:G-X-X-X-Q-X-W domain-containing protein n=1 Tax=Lyophyllum shimeji TaxID=47721 RepID=A0A9P3PEJ6_LYOSH|nr:putative G-X-X-X-Q-X-W domain-containing protein [Lyophyllum shimeji]